MSRCVQVLLRWAMTCVDVGPRGAVRAFVFCSYAEV
jgi:hypothetical protein